MRPLIALYLFALVYAKPSGYIDWSNHGPSGVVNAFGPARFVDGHEAIGPNIGDSSDGSSINDGNIGIFIISDGEKGWNNENHIILASGNKHNHWGDHGPSGITNGHGVSGPSGDVDGLGARGPAGIVTGHGAIGPNGEHNGDGEKGEILILNSEEICDDEDGNGEILIKIDDSEDKWVDNNRWDGSVILLEDNGENCDNDGVSLVDLTNVHI